MTDQNQQRPAKRTLQSTFTLLCVMLATSARDAGEKAFKPIVEALLELENPVVIETINELYDQGYLDADQDGNIRMSKYGEKVALQSTHNTPNFSRLADSNTNIAFAMMFAGFSALRDKHLVEQKAIVAGDNGNTLVTNLKEMINFFEERLTTPETLKLAEPVFEKKVSKPPKKVVVEIAEQPVQTEQTV